MLYLVRYGEIGIKSEGVRKRYLQILRDNLRRALENSGSEYVIREERGRLFIHSGSEAEDILAHTFGVVSYSLAREVGSGIGDIGDAVLDAAGNIPPGRSFAMRTRRTGSHDYTSMSLAAAMGEKVLGARPDLRVDLGSPEEEIFVEVRSNRAYVFRDVVRGPGGLPVGTQGRVLCPVGGEEDTRAGLLMARRGCVPVFASCNRYDLPRIWLQGREVKYDEGAPDDPKDLLAHAVESGHMGLVMPWGPEEIRERIRELPVGGPVYFPLAPPPPFADRMVAPS